MAEVRLVEKLSKRLKDGIVKRIDWQLILVLSAFVVIVLFLRAPNGWKTTGTQEGWIFYSSVVTRGNIFPNPNDMLAPRPLVLIPWVIAFNLVNNSFAGMQILLAFLWWLKAVILYLILRQLKLGTVVFAFFVAIFSISLPADRANFAEYALSRHLAVVLYLNAVLFLILSIRKGKPLHQVIMSMSLLASCLISEQGVVLIFATPLAAFLVDNPFRQKKMRKVIYLWYLVVFAYIIFFVLTTIRISDSSYQVRVFQAGTTGNVSLISETLKSTFMAYRRGFWDGWQDYFVYTFIDKPAILRPALIITFVSLIVGLLLLFFNRNSKSTALTKKRLILLVAGGLILYGLGYFPYALTQFRYDPYRVFFYSLFGEAIVFLAVYQLVVSILGRWQSFALIVISCVTIFFASLNTINNNAIWVTRSRLQQQLMVSMMEQAPYIKRATTVVVVFDKRDVRPFVTMGLFNQTLRWMYPNTRPKGIMCYEDYGNCVFNAKYIYLDDPENPSLNKNRFYYGNVLLFRYLPDEGVALLDQIPQSYQSNISFDGYQPYERIVAYTPFPERVINFFESAYLPDPARIAPKGWVGNNATMNDRKVCNTSYSGSCSLLIESKVDAGFDQTLSLDGNPEDVVETHLCARNNEDEVVDSGQGSVAILTVKNLDGSFEDYPLSVDQLTKEWNCYVSSNIVTKSYSAITIYLKNPSMSNQIWIDDLSIHINGILLSVENPSFEY